MERVGISNILIGIIVLGIAPTLLGLFLFIEWDWILGILIALIGIFLLIQSLYLLYFELPINKNIRRWQKDEILNREGLLKIVKEKKNKNEHYENNIVNLVQVYGVLTKNIPYYYEPMWQMTYSRICESYQISLINSNGELNRKEAVARFMSEDEFGKSFRKIDKSFLIFESSKTVFFEGNSYKFKDIISFEVFDNSKTIYSASSAISSTNTGSMLGRAAMGGILFGGIGAAIGGVTAKKEIQISGSSTYTTHDYEIVITVNSLSTPTVKLSLLGQQDIVQEITSILLIILERNKQHI